MESLHELPCAWDDFDAYLFDIDGTLLNCTDATHYFAFSHALKLLTGRDLTIDGVVAHGNVDVGILRDALARAGIAEEQWRPRITEAQNAMADFVTIRREEVCTSVSADVPHLLEYLRGKGATLGVATGNLERIGQLKLEQAKLWKYFDFGGWSDAYEYRADVFRAALGKARALCGPEARICVLGDTPADIRAARENQVPAIAIATGTYTYDQLRREEPQMLLHSFSELFSDAPQS